MAFPIGHAAPAGYTPDKESVDQHPAAPEWFQDAKFGIYFHWGVFSVPAYDNEWYPRWMFQSGSRSNTHHVATYGTAEQFPYHRFIDGGTDRSGRFVQFAPTLRSAGGAFDPDEWVQLFVDAGARYAGPVAEHHDGYSMWDSAVNEWNSAARGPRLDLLGLFAGAVRRRGLKFLVAMHHAYHYNGYFQYVAPQSDPSLRKLYGQLPRDEMHTLWYAKLREVLQRSQPDVLYQDFSLDKVGEAERLQFLADFYNQGLALDKEVVATYKDGFDDQGEVYDFERGGPAGLRYPYWLTDDCVSSSSWCYTEGIGYYSPTALLHCLIDRVSKNGNLLLNIAPRSDGSIPQGQRDILLAIGDHLRRYGEAVYSTRAWTAFGEGPTMLGGGTFTQPKPGTARDIRFTRDKAGTVLYATVLGWPGDGAVLDIATLAAGRIDLSTLRSAQLLGPEPGHDVDLPDRTQDGTGLHVRMPPSAPATARAYVLRLTFSGPIPPLTPAPE